MRVLRVSIQEGVPVDGQLMSQLPLKRNAASVAQLDSYDTTRWSMMDLIGGFHQAIVENKQIQLKRNSTIEKFM